MVKELSLLERFERLMFFSQHISHTDNEEIIKKDKEQREEDIALIKTALKDNEWLNKELVKFEKAFAKENEEKLKLKEEVEDLRKAFYEKCDETIKLCNTYEKKLKAFEIINNKDIDIWLLKVCDYDNYCRIRTKCLETNVGSMVDCDKPAIPLPTKEEFDLLKEELE